jgi:drug/metabolite transporter (DMT)-like permease
MRNNTIVVALVAAAVMLGVAYGLKHFVSTGALDEIISKRIMGALMGIYLAAWGNYIPKMLKPMSKKQCSSARVISLHRIAGWALVLAGLGYAAVWLFAPIEHTSVISMSIVATCLVLVLALLVSLIMSRKRSQPPAGA